MDIHTLRDLVREGKRDFRWHALRECRAEGIAAAEVDEAVLSGEIIKEQEGSFGTTYLVEGVSGLGRRLRVVCGLEASQEDQQVWYVTAYERQTRRQR